MVTYFIKMGTQRITAEGHAAAFEKVGRYLKPYLQFPKWQDKIWCRMGQGNWAFIDDRGRFLAEVVRIDLRRAS